MVIVSVDDLRNGLVPSATHKVALDTLFLLSDRCVVFCRGTIMGGFMGPQFFFIMSRETHQQSIVHVHIVQHAGTMSRQ